MKRILTRTFRTAIISVALVAVVASVAIGCATSPAIAPLEKETVITIIHTNDIHSRTAPNKDQLGYERIGAVVETARASSPNTLVIDAGDTLHGLPIANLEKGASITRLMNAVGYDYMTVGNHDFNYGQERLFELQKQIAFPILAANVYKNGKRLFTAWDLRELGGVRVAVFGLASPETSYKTDPKGIEGIVFTDPVEEAAKVMKDIGSQADLIVCISHVGIDPSSSPTSLDIAAKVPGIHVIVDGHSHSTLEQIRAVNGTATVISSAGEYGKAVGRIDITVGTDRRILSVSPRLVTAALLDADASSKAVKAVHDDIVAKQAGVLDEKAGETAIALVGAREVVRTSQSNLGTLIAASMLDVSGADLALVNGGGIRDSIPAGPITKRHIFTVLPFGNYAQTIEVTGTDILAALENGVGKLPAPDGRYPHVAGVTFTVDASKAAGSRVSNVMIGGKPLEENATYILATANFLVNGGDEYTMFKGKKIINEYPSDAEVFLRYIQKLGVISGDTL